VRTPREPIFVGIEDAQRTKSPAKSGRAARSLHRWLVKERLMTKRKPRTTDQPEASVHQGTGPVLERTYHVVIPAGRWRPESIVALLRNDLSRFAPRAVHFHRRGGRHGELRPGDELNITVAGLPLLGQVRVADVSSLHFTLQTLKGHPEAGINQFLAVRESTEKIRVQLTSRFRQNGILAFVSYWLGSKALQTHTWKQFLTNVARHCSPQWNGEVKVETRTVPARAAESDIGRRRQATGRAVG